MRVSHLTLMSALAAALMLSGCSSTRNDGKYYDNDGPPSAFGALGMSTRDAVPKVEKPIAATNRPYKVMGKTYQPMTGDKPLVQTGYGSWYGKQFHGKKTSTGEIYDMYKMSAAHTTMELPSYAKVTNLENGRSVIVRVNDRGPFLHSRVIDLSYAAATKLGYVKKGTAKVKVERITRAQIAAGQIPSTSSGSVLAAAAPLAKKVFTPTAGRTASSSSDVPDSADFVGEIALAAAQNAGITEFASPIVSADRVVITPDPSMTSSIREHVETAAEAKRAEAMQQAQTTLDAFETEAREEVIDALRQKASDSKTLTAVKDAAAAVQSAAPMYAVQLGVFRSEENALALRKRFYEAIGDKLAAKARIETVNGLHKVIVGDSMTQEQAKAAVAVVRDVLNIKAFVLKQQ